ncbi:MAG TPA: histidine phosphatase family protein [Acidimicrobiales bacterium]|nr:histidine phosphatase family protein [Acidimicrobiales bacterium]
MTEAADASAPRTYRQVRFEHAPGSTEILLVRHGESAVADPGNPFTLLDGRGDPELSPEGCVQAEALAERLAKVGIDAIYVTPLRRTAETAAPLAARLGVEPVVEPGMVEVNMGEWEGGLYRRMIAERSPLAMRVFREERWDVIPGAESNESLFTRTGAAIGRIAERHRDGRVVVVAHAVSIGTVLAQAARSSPFAFVAGDNASVSTLVVAGDRWTVRRFNDTAHLE